MRNKVRAVSRYCLLTMIGSSSDIVFGTVCPCDTPIAFQLPGVIRAVGQPVGYSSLRARLARRHRDSGLVAVGHDLLKAQLAVAENGYKCNEHVRPRFAIKCQSTVATRPIACFQIPAAVAQDPC